MKTILLNYYTVHVMVTSLDTNKILRSSFTVPDVYDRSMMLHPQWKNEEEPAGRGHGYC